MYGYRGMSAGLPQVPPMFCKIDIKVRLRPENFGGDLAAKTLQGNIVFVRVSINATATAHALDIASHKPTFGSTLSNEPQSIVVS
jgi:hypothetical protein